MPTEILPNLFLGQRPRSYDGYDVVVNCERRVRPELVYDWRGTLMHVPMVDEPDFEVDELAVRCAAILAAGESAAGHPVLVHCAAGRNRSGLVVGLVVRLLLDCSGEEAIRLIRAARDLTGGRDGRPVLSNEAFAALVCA